MSTNKQQQLKELHKKRKNETEKRIYEAIDTLKEKGIKINFNTVAEESGVSKRTLYNKPEIVLAINEMRTVKKPQKKKISDDSKDSIIKMLKRKIEALEEENAFLKKKNSDELTDFYRKL